MSGGVKRCPASAVPARDRDPPALPQRMLHAPTTTAICISKDPFVTARSLTLALMCQHISAMYLHLGRAGAERSSTSMELQANERCALYLRSSWGNGCRRMWCSSWARACSQAVLCWSRSSCIRACTPLSTMSARPSPGRGSECPLIPDPDFKF